MTTSAYAVRVSESRYDCSGCGRVFSVFGSCEPNSAPAMRVYSLAADGQRAYNLNKGRAVRHARSCSKES